MNLTLFASTLAAALTATSFGEVEVELLQECCGNWFLDYTDQVLTFDTTNDYGYTRWEVNVPTDTWVSFNLSWNDEYNDVDVTALDGAASAFTLIEFDWVLKNMPDSWSGSFFLPEGTYRVGFYEIEGFIDFGSQPERVACCVNSRCVEIPEANCSSIGGTWIDGGSCDDCEPVADDCPADVDGDGSIGFSDVLIILNDWGACP